MKTGELQKLQRTTSRTATSAKVWFEAESELVKKAQFKTTGGLKDAGTGAVYVYFRNKNVEYVGETSRKVKARMHDVTSPHKKAKWWPTWTHMRFLQISNRTDRLTLELLLVLGYLPKYNEKPGARSADELFASYGKR